MRSLVSVTAGFLAFFTLAVAGVPSHASSPEDSASPVPVPGSLDALYPPRTKRPVLLLQMLQLDEALSGVVVDVSEQDLAGAWQNLDAFTARYAELRSLVPEWTDQYPAAPVEGLRAALSSGDRDRVMGAVGRVGETCHRCHAATMVPVQQRYRWGDFAGDKVIDPTTGELLDFLVFKRRLSTSMAGVGVNLRQGQIANALQQFKALRERFQQLGDSCLTCHAQGGRVFLSPEISGLLEELGQALSAPEPAAETVAPLLQRIGQESCSKCHLVHVPAAMAKAATR